MALIVSYDDRSYQKKFLPLHGKLCCCSFPCSSQLSASVLLIATLLVLGRSACKCTSTGSLMVHVPQLLRYQCRTCMALNPRKSDLKLGQFKL